MNDEGMWSYIGRIWVEHDIAPYKGSVENKSPGIFLVHYISYDLFGINYLFPRILGLLSVVLTTYLIFKIGSLINNEKAGFISSVLFSFIPFWSAANGPVLDYTENFMILFTTSFFIILLNCKEYNIIKTFFFAGACFGLAISFKQIAILPFLGSFLYIFYKLKEPLPIILALLFLILGALLTTFLTLLPLMISGTSLYNYINGAWQILLNEGSSYPLSFYRIPKFFEMFFNSRIVLFYPILLIGIYRISDLKKAHSFRYLTAWLIIAFIGVNSSGYYSDHQIVQMLPPLTLFCGIALSNALNISRSKYFYYYLTFGLLILFPYNVFFSNTISIVNSKDNLVKALENQFRGNSENANLGRWIDSNTQKDDRIYCCCKFSNSIMSYSDKRSASKYFNLFFVTAPSIKQKVRRDLKKQEPEIVIKEKIISEDFFLANFLRTRYSKVKENKHVIVFRKNNS